MISMSRLRVTSPRHYRAFEPEIVRWRATVAVPGMATQEKRYRRVDWRAMEFEAAQGRLPAPPKLTTDTACWHRIINEIHQIAKSGDAKKLAEFRLAVHNSVTRAISKYRAICLTYLKSRSR